MGLNSIWRHIFINIPNWHPLKPRILILLFSLVINKGLSLRTEVRGHFNIHGTENAFSVITNRVNISCRGQVFWPTKITGGLEHHTFLIFDGKQHPKNIWFRGC